MQDRSDGGVTPRRFAGRLRTADESTRVTTFELFFDLVYVFAFTQVTGLMAETHSAFGILQAMIVLGLLWWTWEAYGWLSNQSPADQPVMRIGMSVAMISVFIIALTVPEAFDDLPGGWHGPLVLAFAYTIVRLVHAALYLAAAGRDRALQRQVVMTVAVAGAPAMIALIVGALVGGPAQTWIWLGAFLYDFAVTYASSRQGGNWRIYSTTHWAERHGLIVILALGESIVAIGVGVAQEPIDAAVVLGAVLSVLLSILLWWSYFVRAAAAGEHELERRTDAARAMLGINGYTYLHLAIISGIILAALGVEDAMAHIGDVEHYGWFGAAALSSGLALYIGATAVFLRVVGQPWSWVRIIAAVALIALIPVLAAVAPIGALAIAALVLVAALVIESVRGRAGLDVAAAN